MNLSYSDVKRMYALDGLKVVYVTFSSKLVKFSAVTHLSKPTIHATRCCSSIQYVTYTHLNLAPQAEQSTLSGETIKQFTTKTKSLK